MIYCTYTGGASNTFSLTISNYESPFHKTAAGTEGFTGYIVNNTNSNLVLKETFTNTFLAGSITNGKAKPTTTVTAAALDYYFSMQFT